MLDTLRGTVRPVLVYAFSAALIAGFFLGLIPEPTFTPIALLTIGYWFGSRNPTNRTEPRVVPHG